MIVLTTLNSWMFMAYMEVSIGFLSHGATPNHPVVMDDHDLVLKPMVTWVSPILRTTQKSWDV